MKIKKVAAAGAIGIGMGVAGFIGGGTASADTCPPPDPTPTTPVTQRVACLAQNYTNSFLTTIDPRYNANVLIFGTVDDNGNRSGLGLVDQPATFAQSLRDFFSGPVGPDAPPEAANANTPPPGS